MSRTGLSSGGRLPGRLAPATDRTRNRNKAIRQVVTSVEGPFVPVDQRTIPLLLRVGQLDPHNLPRGAAPDPKGHGESQPKGLGPAEESAFGLYRPVQLRRDYGGSSSRESG